jgi:hypothetical protein
MVGRLLPIYIEAEFDAYLKCGRLVTRTVSAGLFGHFGKSNTTLARNPQP